VSLAYFPLFPTDFDADTGHLSLAEDGAYNRLLRLSWRCPEAKMPNDLDWIYRKARAVTDEDKAVLAGIIAEFFTCKSGKVFSDKLHKIWREANAAHVKRVEAGKNGGRAKAAKTKDMDPSNATELPGQCSSNQNQNQNHIEKREAKASPQKSRGSRIPDDWILPLAWGQWAVSEGLTPDVVRVEADKFKDYWIGKSGKDAAKADWQATWRNWIRSALERKAPQLSAINGGRNGRQQFDAAHKEYTARIASGAINRGPDPSDPFAR
jgi:uncharacterized protein YdaU (DUF1376 family)